MTKAWSWSRAVGPVLILAAIFCAYSNSFRGPFVFDDPSSITGNRTIRQLGDLGAILRTPRATVTAQGRPVLNFTLALNYAAGHADVVGYHAVNVAIHAAAALVLLGVLRRLFRRVPRLAPQADALACAVALLWAVHPLQTESVTYIIQRAESLMGVFYLLTIYAFMRGMESGPLDSERLRGGRALDSQSGPPLESLTRPFDSRCSLEVPIALRWGRWGWWGGLSVAAAYLGMATKEDMVSAPLAVLLYDWLLEAGSLREALRRRWGLHAALASSWFLLAYLIWTTGGNRGGSVGFGLHVQWTAYWLTQFPALSRYLCVVFWPHPLVFEYGTFWLHRFADVWGDAAMAAALVGGTLWALRRAPLIGWIGAVFFAILAPTSLVPGTTQMIVEHRMYLPLACLVGLAVGGVAAAEIDWRETRGPRPRARVTFALVAAAAVAGTFATRARNRDYRNAVGLWGLTVAQRPDNVLARTMLGDALRRAGRERDGIAQYREAVRLNPGFALAQEELGDALLHADRVDDAIDHFRAALRARPRYADAEDNLGVALGRRNRLDAAIAHVRRAIAIKPDYAAAHYNLAKLLDRAGRPKEAVPEYRLALRYEPEDAAAHADLGELLAELHRTDEATKEYAEALRLRPDDAQAQYNWGVALTDSRQFAAAIAHYRAAIRLRPDYLDARDNLATALYQTGRYEEARAECREALRQSPADAFARRTLGLVERAGAGSPP